MKAIWNNRTIAESDKTIIIEGNHYFPSESVKKEFLKESEHTSECVWKGTAHYFHIQVEEKINQNAGWYYPHPKEGSVERVGEDFSNYIAFWNGVIVEE
ncbi:hypothetical protein COU15_00925 [Candidatus Kaiserbacteria bacterium CG10_big_fil_rev_8_21_14_0_10_45_20]|uniref:DUF427 domain-containing protein n=1 Tax=Candidatus Kaiserbacteria bacterium CG10_big_fil_rev_8_21_14_0_10_45_20 TaxID=1974607 RepID=A0A2H0UG24_9BACT|nr:MAG: hypothetical protein COU15_00925 [Candidatus Kaiserbacteria bacterium CG10_big_fil_rev_8_21_14_0_10_45_20]